MLSVIDDNSIPVEILLKISVDGVPLSKSSKSQLWPLTAMIANLEFERVFLIGLWHGESKPSDVNEYLREFIEEAKKLSDEGFTFRGKRIRFQIVLYICDAPARSFLKCIKSHTGFFGCPYCIQEGEYHGRTVFLHTDSGLRTDFSFRKRVHEEHHLGDPDLEKLNCDMVLDFPNCPQHLIDLGVTRKMMRKWIVGPRPHKLRPAEIQQLSNDMVELQVFIPFEFARKTRSLDFFPQFKSTELALFNSYVGPIVLKNILPEREYNNFIVFHVAVKLMSSKKYCHSLNSYIKNLLIFFVNDSCVIYGKEFLSYNVHNLLHLGDQILRFGPLYNFSVYPFESFYQIFKKFVRKGNQVLQQIVKRVMELNVFLLQGVPLKHKCSIEFRFEHTSGPMFSHLRPAQQFQEVKYHPWRFSIKTKADCTVYLKNKTVVFIENFVKQKDRTLIIGRAYLKTENFYDYPFESSNLDTFSVGELSRSHEFWDVNEIMHKLVRLPMPEKEGFFVVFPLLMEKYNM